MNNPQGPAPSYPGNQSKVPVELQNNADDNADELYNKTAPEGNPPSYSAGQPYNQYGGNQPYGYNQGYGGNPGYDQTVVTQPAFNMMGPGQQPYMEVPDYMGLSIVSIFFCTCFGIYAIVTSSNVRTLKASGRYQDAQQASRRARNSAIAAIIIGVILTPIIICARAGVFD